jgi:DNA-binding response OmpR family regulator
MGMEQETSQDGERKILIADDDADSRVIVASVVSLMGYTPIVVVNGNEAVRASSQEKPHLAILDYMMPDLSGVEVCARIKNNQADEFVPVLMLTARDTVRDKVSAFEEGVDDYLTKPFNYQEFQARVKALLRVRDLTVSLRETNAELRLMQQRLIEKERQLAVGQLAGTAAHQLGQPLSSILLNCYLIEQLPKTDPKFIGALAAIKSDTKRMGELINQLRSVKASDREGYYGDSEILKLREKDSQKE